MQCNICNEGTMRIVDFADFQENVLICDKCLRVFLKDNLGIMAESPQLELMFTQWDAGRGILAKRVLGYPLFGTKNAN